MAWNSAQKGRNHGKHGDQKRHDFPQKSEFSLDLDCPVRVGCWAPEAMRGNIEVKLQANGKTLQKAK
jgi:hypothetical protein